MDANLMVWLGPAATALTPTQLEQLADASRDIDARYPEPDDADRREAALTAATQHLLGDVTIDDASRTLIDARAHERRAYAGALQMAVMAVRVAGTPKAVAARRAGIDRMSLLQALGERAPR